MLVLLLKISIAFNISDFLPFLTQYFPHVCFDTILLSFPFMSLNAPSLFLNAYRLFFIFIYYPPNNNSVQRSIIGCCSSR